MGGASGPNDVEEEIQYRMGSVPEKLMSSLYPFQVIRLLARNDICFYMSDLFFLRRRHMGVP